MCNCLLTFLKQSANGEIFLNLSLRKRLEPMEPVRGQRMLKWLIHPFDDLTSVPNAVKNISCCSFAP